MRLKKDLSFFSRAALTLLLMLLSTTMWAFDYTDANGITWSCTIIESTTNVSIVPKDKSSLPASVTIPSSVTDNSTDYTVTSIGEIAFYNCYGLTSITIPGSVTTIGKNAFAGSHLATVSFGTDSHLTTIGDYSFYNCWNLPSITLPASVTSIGESTFYRCTGLTSITIPASVTSIGKTAFHSCSGLTSITIPSSVTSIGAGAFYACTSLASVIVNRAAPVDPAPTIDLYAFDNNATVRKIYVPSTSFSSFQTVWSAYSSDIVSQIDPYAALATNITVNRDLNKPMDYWGTYYNATVYSMEVPSGVKIYKAKVNDAKTRVVLTEIAGNTITVGQAVVLKCNVASVTSTNTIQISQKHEAAGNYTDNELKGGTTVTSGYDAYTLASGSSGVGFYKFTGEALNPNKAHLEIPQTAGARTFYGFSDGDATAIELPEMASDSDDGDIYDLMGRKMQGQPTTKGIYVKQGKKYIVK